MFDRSSASQDKDVSHVVDAGGMPVLGGNIDPVVDVIAGDGAKLQPDWSFLDTLGVDGEGGLELLGEAGLSTIYFDY